jgi:acetyl-CoA carboxylase biotin carboxyl carrier protein
LSEKRKQRRNGGGGADAGGSTGGGGGGGPPASDSPMDVRLLEQIVKLMAVNDLNTVDVRDGDKRVILKRGAVAPSITYASPMQMPMAQGGPSQPSAAAAGSSGASTAPAATDENAGLTPIKAEMVGTFYSAPKPGEKPFVSVGSEVDEDTEVCLIEAMKNYFAVKAGVTGTIARVLAQDGQTVQFDQPLFLVRPR